MNVTGPSYEIIKTTVLCHSGCGTSAERIFTAKWAKNTFWQALPGLYLFKPFTSNGDVFRRVKHSRQTDRQTERERDRQGERDGQTETERQTQINRDRHYLFKPFTSNGDVFRRVKRTFQTDRQTDRQREKERERDRQTDRERQGERDGQTKAERDRHR